ncbi:MAG TPA: acyl-homoserine-lactone synthase [Rudaea sp.]|jgi:N-acyl-L-homoserine lactone synthetase|nr:acyl-homoserine-lactone synthase [Rudaea sp.]
MVTIESGTQQQLRIGVEAELAAYRYKVFVEHLGWDLPIAQIGSERDEFDRPDTFYVVVKDDRERICGCARLLPTTHPYLLGMVFPQLMGDQPLPMSADIWELSRYTTQLVNGELTSRQEAADRFRQLLKAVCDAAFRGGAKRLITFSYLGVERIARNFGIHVHRVGPSELIDGRPVVAFWIELDEQTFCALNGAAPLGSVTH